ncbi:hypothetical protein DFJ75_4988 [Williamsia muralis]|uniref:Uncharacterized protein n=1 Tax=Williamsia marianensis TaxID=85044 RepID=A0A495IST7_WILMA|nr:hypothetical protein [Williamsia muralis]RKR79845.1 hypothetical protein DFJ75_4988 [Williamsia muralis]
MICWSVTAFTLTDPHNGILIANADTTYTDAHHAAGDAALAALDHLAGHQPNGAPFLTISIDDNPLLLAGAGRDEHGNIDREWLTNAAIHVRDTGTAYSPEPTLY